MSGSGGSGRNSRAPSRIACAAASGIALVAACDHRHHDALGRERAHERADILREVAQHDVDPPVRAQAREPGLAVRRLVELRPARHREPCRLAKLSRKRADDENAHGQLARSAFTISVIVTPRRLSSTITTSPRATRRLLT